MATDLAEVLGGGDRAVASVRMPLIVGMAVTAVITYAILLFESERLPPGRTDHRRPGRHDRALLPGRDIHRQVRLGGGALFIRLRRKSPDAEALLISVGIIGATVMPHAIYLHSGLDADAHAGARRDRTAACCCAFPIVEVVIALAIAGLVNMAMVIMAVERLPCRQSRRRRDRGRPIHTLSPLLGIGAAGVFLLSLIASGFELGGRDHGRADDHAGLSSASAFRSGCGA